MFGMSSEEFWEQDPTLYWSYRTFYFKQKEIEQEKLKYESWLNGKINSISVSVAIANCFGKNKIDYPTYKEMFGEFETQVKKLSPKEKKNKTNMIVQSEFNAWARL